MDETFQHQNKYKRKRKTNFLKNARKYAKKGCYGRGSQLEADTYQYFVRIMEAYKEGFPSDDEKGIFVNNVFEQTLNQEINCCCNQVGCRVIEELLPYGNNEVLYRYMEVIGGDLRKLCSDRFASHVIEALVKEAAARSLKQDDKDVSDKYSSFLLKVSKFLLNNLEDYVSDTYGNHILRTVLTSLAQLPKETNNYNNVQLTDMELNMPLEYSGIIEDYGERLLTWPQFRDLVYSELTSGFLQVLLRALERTHPKLLKKYLNKLLTECFLCDTEEGAERKLADAFFSKSAIMLLETAIQVAKSKMYTQIYAKCFVGNLSKLALMRSTNFAVQKLLNFCVEKSEFEAMFDELADYFKEIWQAGHTGVLLALAKTCKRLSAKQGSYLVKLMECLDCHTPEERQKSFALCISRFQSYDEIQNKDAGNLQREKLNLHGTLILQFVLEFNKPIKVVNSILSIENTQLCQLLSNPMGCHIADSFVKSSFIGEKSRDKLIKKLQGSYQELAASKYGSRAFEAVWDITSFKNKIAILDELSHKDGAWSNNEFGRIVANKVKLQLYKRNKEEWKNSLNKSDKVKSLLNILN